MQRNPKAETISLTVRADETADVTNNPPTITRMAVNDGLAREKVGGFEGGDSSGASQKRLYNLRDALVLERRQHWHSAVSASGDLRIVEV